MRLEHSNAQAGNGIRLNLKDEKQADVLQIYTLVLCDVCINTICMNIDLCVYIYI